MPQTASTGAKPAVLVIEDERALAEEIRYELQAEGYPVALAETRAEGLRVARAGGAAVLVVDRILNHEDGLSILEALRQEGNPTPILVISALSSVDDRIRGLKAGGDDYLVKPFELRELTARVEALSRRIPDSRATRLRAGPLEMDLVERSVRRGDLRVDLLPREFKLLEYFMRRPNQIVTRAMLLEDVWNYKFLPQTNVVDVLVCRLRNKIDRDFEPKLIHTLRGAGYSLRLP